MLSLIYALSLIVCLLGASPAQAFEFPLTKSQRAQKLVEQGQGLILRGDFAQAIDSCTRALSIRGDWAPAYLCRSEARLLSKDPDAGRDAQRALKLDPQSGEPWRLLGIMEFQAGRYQTALQQFNVALSRSKLRPEGVPDVYFYRARTHMSLGRYDDALKDVGQGLGVLQGLNGDFSDWTFYSLRAEILRHLGQNRKADGDERHVISLINERIKRRPTDAVDLLRRRAESYSLLREYDKAASDYGEVLNRGSDDVKSLLDRAQALSMSGRHDAAIRDINRALTLDPRNAAALRQRALERVSLNDHAGAVKDLDDYLAIEPIDATAIAHRAVSKRFLEDFRGSLKDIDLAQKLRPSDQSLWGDKAFAQEMLGQHEAAMASAAKALKIDPDDLSAHAARAQAGAILGRCREVGDSLDWLMKKSPASGQYRWLRGECRCDGGDFVRGLEDLEAAVAAEPKSPLLAARLAHQHRRYLDDFPLRSSVEELRRSLRLFDAARALAPLEPTYRIDRARTLLQLGMEISGTKTPAERMALWREALMECAAVLKKDRNDRVARDLRLKIRRQLKSSKGPMRP